MQDFFHQQFQHVWTLSFPCFIMFVPCYNMTSPQRLTSMNNQRMPSPATSNNPGCLETQRTCANIWPNPWTPWHQIFWGKSWSLHPQLSLLQSVRKGLWASVHAIAHLTRTEHHLTLLQHGILHAAENLIVLAQTSGPCWGSVCMQISQPY